jgi:hypothetical protein
MRRKTPKTIKPWRPTVYQPQDLGWGYPLGITISLDTRDGTLANERAQAIATAIQFHFNQIDKVNRLKRGSKK